MSLFTHTITSDITVAPAEREGESLIFTISGTAEHLDTGEKAPLKLRYHLPCPVVRAGGFQAVVEHFNTHLPRQLKVLGPISVQRLRQRLERTVKKLDLAALVGPRPFLIDEVPLGRC